MPFTKGDPNINRTGRPLYFDKIRVMAQLLANEEVKDQNGQPLMYNGVPLTNAEYVLRSMIADPRYRRDFLEIAYGKVPNPVTERDGDVSDKSDLPYLPADIIADSFLPVYRDIRAAGHVEYLLRGGRGSTKSSFASLAGIHILINNPDMHGLAVRQTANTLRDSVFAQLRWAIDVLGLTSKFKCTTSPLEIVYTKTGQTIYFRGGDDPLKIKSIKPEFGYIGWLWFEELDQFRGPEAVRSIEQSAIRGGDLAFIFKGYNPPLSSQNWANKYALIPKANQLQHYSTYLDVPHDWLGQVFIDEAEHLKQVNPTAYEHEYLGIATGTGGMVFENVVLAPITDEEIKNFDRVLFGLDWGYFPDPFSFGKMHYDAARHILYIFGEFRGTKLGNEEAWNAVCDAGLIPRTPIWNEDHTQILDYTSTDLIIADSAEPKSIADFRSYGASIRGAEKGPDSVHYSIKWLQSLTEIRIDPMRAPYHAEEFTTYELERDKDGEFISAYPDHDNHAIDDTRYATNLIWRRRGQ